MKKEISDFIGALVRAYKRSDCICFDAREKVLPFFFAISQEDIDFFNGKLKEIIDNEKNEGKYENNKNMDPRMKSDFIRGTFLKKKEEVLYNIRNKEFSLFTEPYCFNVDVLILRLIEVFA